MSEHFFLHWQKYLNQNYWFKFLCSFYGLYFVFLYLPVVVYLFFLPQYRVLAGLIVFATVFSRYGICEIIYQFYKSPRPYQKYNFETKFFWLFSQKHKRYDSFPSGHSTASSVIAVLLFSYSVWLGVLALFLSVFADFSRVILGFHFPKDVFWGFVFGSTFGLILLFFYQNGYLLSWLNLVK